MSGVLKAENVGEGTKKEQTLAHRTALDEPDEPLSCSERHRTCSTARQRTVVPRSGRRGRRFKSCHPDQWKRSFRPSAGSAKRNAEGTNEKSRASVHFDMGLR